MRYSFLLFFLLITPMVSVRGEGSSLTDREIIERLTRLEEGQKALNQRVNDLENSLNKRIDGLENSLNKRIDNLQGLLWVVLAGMFALVGFVIWDRRTAISPVAVSM